MAARQMNAQANSSKDNPGTLPISADGRRMLGRKPLTSFEEVQQNIRMEENTPTGKEA